MFKGWGRRMSRNKGGSRREIFVVIEQFLVLTGVVITQIYTSDKMA